MGKERKKEKKRNREREKRGRERRNIIHTTNRGVCLRATDLTIFWLVSGVASGRKASDGLTRVEQIYKQKKKTKKQLTQTTVILQLIKETCTYMCTKPWQV